MSIFGAIGLGILIVVLQSLAPMIFTQGQATAVSVLHLIEVGANKATDLTAAASFAPLFDPPSLPRMPELH
jgi:hypothetical protein